MKALFLILSLVIGHFSYVVGNICIFSSKAQTKTTNSLKPNDEDNIREVVFRKLFNPNGSVQKQNANAYYIAIGNHNKLNDPDEKFIERFKSYKPPVKKFSGAKIEKEGVFNKKTGDKGLVFAVTSIKTISENEVEVRGNYYKNAREAAGSIFTVKRIEKKWVVTNHQIDWLT